MSNILSPFYKEKKIFKFKRNKSAANFDKFSFLKKKSILNLIENLMIMKGDFEVTLDLGCDNGGLTNELLKIAKIKKLYSSDISFKMLEQALKFNNNVINLDEEMMPFRNNIFNAILSCLYCHQVNDLNTFFKRLNDILRPDGLLLLSTFGSRTLFELKESLVYSESELNLGASPRTLNFPNLISLGKFIQDAGFTLPVLDTHLIKV